MFYMPMADLMSEECPIPALKKCQAEFAKSFVNHDADTQVGWRGRGKREAEKRGERRQDGKIRRQTNERINNAQEIPGRVC